MNTTPTVQNEASQDSVSDAGDTVECCYIGEDGVACTVRKDIYEIQFTADYMDYTHACIGHLVKLIGDTTPVRVDRLFPKRPMPEQVRLMMECFDAEAGTAFERLLQKRLDVAIQMIGYVSPWTRSRSNETVLRHSGEPPVEWSADADDT